MGARRITAALCHYFFLPGSGRQLVFSDRKSIQPADLFRLVFEPGDEPLAGPEFDCAFIG
jgi:hypothetical protein